MKIINAIIWVGFKFNLLEYSSLNLINPPNPPGRFICWSAIFFRRAKSIKSLRYLKKDLKVWWLFLCNE